MSDFANKLVEFLNDCPDELDLAQVSGVLLELYLTIADRSGVPKEEALGALFARAMQKWELGPDCMAEVVEEAVEVMEKWHELSKSDREALIEELVAVANED